MKLPIQKMSIVTFIFITCFGFFETITYSQQTEDLKISYFVNKDIEPLTVLINAGNENGITEGTLFKSYRTNTTKAKGSVYIETGVLKAVDVQAQSTLAMIIKDGSDLSKATFKTAHGVMAGDTIKEFSYSIDRKFAITPTINLKYVDIFEEPRFGANNLELSKAGEDLLKASLKDFTNIRVKNVIVEAHTDNVGRNEARQLESEQRAAIIKQYMVSELGFDPNKLIAVGFGSSSPESFDDSHSETRRIIIKSID